MPFSSTINSAKKCSLSASYMSDTLLDTGGTASSCLMGLIHLAPVSCDPWELVKEVGQGLHKIGLKAHGWASNCCPVSKRTIVILPSDFFFFFFEVAEMWWVFLMRGCKMELWVQERVKKIEEDRMIAEEDKAGNGMSSSPRRPSGSAP